jgi:hypothetical protein
MNAVRSRCRVNASTINAEYEIPLCGSVMMSSGMWGLG